MSFRRWYDNVSLGLSLESIALDPSNRIIPYLSRPVKPELGRRRRFKQEQLQFGPGTGLVIAIVSLVLSTKLAAQRGDVGLHIAAILLMAAACASSAAGCVVGFGNHDNGYLPVRKQIFGGIVGLIDLVLTFTTVIAFAGLLTF
jgi:hypothetical protein